MALAGTTSPPGTVALAPTRALGPIRASCSTTEAVPMSDRSWTTQPSRWARWPMVQSSPTMVGCLGVQWITAPSWTLLRAPMRIRPSSPRSTAWGHTEASGPSSTAPITTASGWT